MRRLTAREGCFLQRTTLVRNVSALRNTRKRHGAVESGQSAMIFSLGQTLRNTRISVTHSSKFATFLLAMRPKMAIT